MLRLRKDPFFDVWESIFYDTPSFYPKKDKFSNVIDNNNDYRLQLAVPGLSKDDVKLSINDGIITISYEESKSDKNYSFTRSFKKEFTLPENIDENNINGKIENGVLEVIIPKTEKKVLERHIPIN